MLLSTPRLVGSPLLAGGTITGDLTVTGNLTVQGTTTAVVDFTTTGDVGIGTDSPTDVLDVMVGVNESIIFTTATGFPSGATGPTHGISLSRNSDGVIVNSIFAEGASGQSLGFKARNDILFYGNQSRTVTFLEMGNVGIGNSLPGELLTVGSGTKHDGYAIRNTAEVQTTDATQTTVDNITLLDENTYHVEAFIIGVQSDGTDRASYHIAATVFRTGAGSATLEGTVTSLHAQESNASLDATFTVSSNDINVSITGIAAETWEWGCTMKFINMSN